MESLVERLHRIELTFFLLVLCWLAVVAAWVVCRSAATCFGCQSAENRRHKGPKNAANGSNTLLVYDCLVAATGPDSKHARLRQGRFVKLRYGGAVRMQRGALRVGKMLQPQALTALGKAVWIDAPARRSQLS
jgi:hypothetical protein